MKVSFDISDGINSNLQTCRRRVIEVSAGASGKASLESSWDQGGGGLAEEVRAWKNFKSWSLLDLDQRPVQPLPCQECALECSRAG